jgi:WD40 repeat protein/energy-coupling factor transporter ATP-binding protein EcfA2
MNIDNQPVATGQKIYNPFPGLRPFGIHESHLFFGREEQTKEVLIKLLQSRFVAIVGPSGSGKSSFIYSGLLPSLQNSHYNDLDSPWEFIIARPGNAPLENLASALHKAETGLSSSEFSTLSFEAILTSLQTHPSALGDFFSRQSYSGKNILILLDQFEELFRHQFHILPSEAENSELVLPSEILIALLIQALKSTTSIYVVLSMRSDFIGECAHFPDLTRKINESHYLIPQMTQEQKRKAILGPVAVGGGQMAPRLVERLLNDLGNNPDQLPILQHALMRTWNYWIASRENEEPLDFKHYEAIGRMDEALSQHADEAFDELTDGQKKICESLFKALTDKGGDISGIRRPTKLSEIAIITDSTEPEIIAVIDKFRQPGRALLTPLAGTPLASDTIVDISHESLMRIWLRLKKWVEEEEEAVQMYLRLAEASAKYQIGQAALLRPPDLQLALNWQQKQKPTLAWAQRYDPAFERVIAYLDYSKSAYETEQRTKEILQKKALRRARLVALILGLFAVITVGFLIFAVTQQIKAREQAEIARFNEKQAKEKTALALSSERNAREQKEIAEQQRAEAHRQEAIAKENEKLAQQERLKAEASEKEARKQQLIAYEQQFRAEANEKLAKEQSNIAIREKNNAYNARLLSIAQAMSVKSLQVLDKDLKLLTAGQAYQFNQTYGGKEDDPYIYEGLYYALKKSREESYNNLKGHSDNVRALASTKSDKAVYSAGSDGKIIRWNTLEKEKSHVVLADQKGLIHHTLALSSNNQTLAAGGDYPFIHLFDLQKTGYPVQKIKVPVQAVWFLSYINNNQGIVFADSATVYFYNLHSFSKVYTTSSKINAIAVNPLDNQLAIGNEAGEIRLLNLNNTASQVLQIKDPVTALSFSNKGSLLAIGDAKGMMRIWNSKTKVYEIVLTGHSARIINIKFSWDDKKIASGSWDKTVRLWNTAAWNNLPIVLKDHTDWVWSISFRSDGEAILAGCRDSFVRVWPTNAKTMADILCDKTKRNMSKQEWEQFVAPIDDISYEKTCPDLSSGDGIQSK